MGAEVSVNAGEIIVFTRVINNRVFPKVDHSARSDRIVLVEYTTGSVVELNFCQRFGKDLTRFWKIIIKQMVNIYQRFDKVLPQ